MGEEDDVDDLLPLYTAAWGKEAGNYRGLSAVCSSMEESLRSNRKKRGRIFQEMCSGEWTAASKDAGETGNTSTAMCSKGAARRNHGGLPQ